MKYSIIIFSIFFSAVFAKAQTNCKGCSCFVNKSMTWNVEMTSNSTNIYLIRGENLKGHQYSIKTLFAQVNSVNGIRTKIVKIQGATVYVKVTNNEYFSHKGEYTVNSFLAILVFTLTENPKCKRVYVDYIENEDSPSPNFFTRKDFYHHYVICNGQ